MATTHINKTISPVGCKKTKRLRVVMLTFLAKIIGLHKQHFSLTAEYFQHCSVGGRSEKIFPCLKVKIFFLNLAAISLLIKTVRAHIEIHLSLLWNFHRAQHTFLTAKKLCNAIIKVAHLWPNCKRWVRSSVGKYKHALMQMFGRKSLDSIYANKGGVRLIF
jgi:hypothetical protein